MPPLGALGAATGAIAIGTAATSTSTTTIILIETRTGTSTGDKLARATNGSTMRNTVEMPRMATEIRPINLADAVRVAPVVRAVSEDLVVRVALVVPEDPVVPVVRAALVVPEDPVVPVVWVALVVPEDLVEPAVPVALVVPAAGELELDRAAAALVRSHPRAQLAVALRRTKSVIAAHRPDLVPRLAAEEDLAAVAETTRAPAAVEVAQVWEAAVTVAAAAVTVAVAAAVTVAVAVAEDIAVAVAAAVVAVDAAAAADAEDKRRIDGEKTMKTKRNTMTSSKMITLAAFILAIGFLAPALTAAPEKKETAAKQEEAQATPQPGQKQFDTPKQAADALIQVATNFDVAAAKEILGPDGEDIVSSEDPVQDKNRATEFAAKAKEKTSVEIDKKNANHAILLVGNDDFPLPIPIMKQKGKWFFDTKVGREEILNRRIGANELNAIQICRGFVEAQHEYAQEKHGDSKVNQYAQRIISTPDKQDGLAWQNADGTWGGPVGEEAAKALEQGYSNPGKPQPYHGYYFKVLKGQGPAAPMGEMDFVVGGAMIGGFALAAAPAEYRVTGVQTFMVGPDGVVYEKDLGADTLKAFQSMDRYNPDKTWKVTEDDVEDDSQD